MLETNALALKEWAVVVQSLAAGKQILLLRKGGLYERQGQFSIEPREFFFFPTYVHQMEQGVTSAAAVELQAALAARPSEEQLVTRHYATVSDVVWIESLPRIAELEGLHCWTQDTVAKRFAYKIPGLYLFLLRVYQLPRAYTLPMLKRYAGCRSWVELGESLSTAGATPVVADEVFARRVEQIKKKLIPAVA
jgi:hypothetical protein